MRTTKLKKNSFYVQSINVRSCEYQHRHIIVAFNIKARYILWCEILNDDSQLNKPLWLQLETKTKKQYEYCYYQDKHVT